MATRTCRRGLPAALIFLALTVSLSGCGGAESREARHMEKGREYFAAENFDKARVEFRNALQINPESAEARYMTGRALERLGSLRDAAQMYQGAIDADTQHGGARASLGRMLVFAGAPARALSTVEPGLAVTPDDADMLTVRAAARVQQKDTAGALADAQRALELAPDNANTVSLLASLYQQQGDAVRAVELLNTAITRSPEAVDLRQVLARLYLANGEKELAEEQLREVLTLEPEDVGLRYQLALYYAGEKRLEDAEKVLREAIAIDPDDVDPKLFLADFVASRRGVERGEAVLREFLAKDKGNTQLALGLGALQQRSNDIDAAIGTYEQIIEDEGVKPAGLTARNRIAALRLREGKEAEARELIAAVLEENPRDSDALLLRGNLALEGNDPKAAIADLRAVLRDQPGSLPVLRTLARAHLINREPALAEENLRAAVEAAPTDPAVRIELAQLLMQTERAESARTMLEDLVRSAPTDGAAREALVRSYLTLGDFDEASRAATDLQTLRPDAAIGFYLAGVAEEAQQRFAQSQAAFAKALEIQPDSADALAAYARVLLRQGKTAEALEQVRTRAAALPKSAPAQNLLGELHLGQRQTEAARAAFSAARDLAPKWWLPYRNLALTAYAEKDEPAAIAAYEAGLAATDEPALVLDLAAAHERAKRPEESIRQYEKLLAKDPGVDVAANNLAMLLVTYRTDAASLDRAKAMTEQFADATNPSFIDTFGWVRYKRGEIDPALTALARAAEKAPDSSVIRFHLGMAQLKAGQFERARESLVLALEGNRKFSGADEARAALASLDARSQGPT